MRLFFIVSFTVLCTICFVTTGFSVRSLAQSSTPYTPWSDVKPTEPPPPPVHLQQLDAQYIKSKIQKTSTIEKLYSGRLIDPLEQFGYDIFTKAEKSGTVPMGAVQDDFVLGAGDELLVTFTGQRSDQNTYKIDTTGMIVIKDLRPIPAMGRTIEQLHETLKAQIASMHNTDVYVSLAKVRQIGVLVVGNVKAPGRKNLNIFNTILDALNSSGGIRKDGSLRQIKLIRGGRSKIIDLYMVLMHGAPHVDLRLQDGDRLVIPPIGSTIAVSGSVKRPGIYEMRKTHYGLDAHSSKRGEKLNMNEMLDLAGGVLVPGANRFLKLHIGDDGKESVTRIDNPQEKIFASGTILSVLKGDEKRHGTVELSGHTRKPGLYDLSKHKTLSSLLQDENVLGDDIYPLLGLVKRWNSDQFTTEFITFPVRSVLKNEFDLSIKDNDVVTLLSHDEISKIYDDKGTSEEQGSALSDKSAADDDDLKSFLKEHSVFVRGAVRKPGRYPVADGITLDTILAVAGGLTLEANKQSIEITSKNFGENYQSEGRSGTQRDTIDLNELPLTFPSRRGMPFA